MKTTPPPSLPVEQILTSIAQSLVTAQQQLDEQSLASELHIQEQELDKNFGLSATWYTIPELDLELRLAFEISSRGEVKSQMVDAEYQSKYGFDLRGSSTLQSKIVAVPPGESSGLSLLDKAIVLKKIGRLKKTVQAWGRCDTPHFDVRYLPFVKQGYKGGLWFAKLMDQTLNGSKIRALVVVDDATEDIVRLWTDEAEAPKGVPFTTEEAFKTIMALNKATEEELAALFSISVAAQNLILEHRPFDSITALGSLDGIGRVTLESIRNDISLNEE